MEHQVYTSDFMTVHPRSFCLNTPGTGKTASALWAAMFMRRQGKIDLTIVISPLSCIEDVWVPELNNIDPLSSVAIAHGANKMRAVAAKRDYILLNHDGVSNQKLNDALAELQRTYRIFVIVDEATAYKNWQASRTRNAAKISNALTRTRVCLMTGTPHPKDPTDIYGMCRIRDPKSVPSSFGKWRNTVMYNPYGFKWVPRDDASEHIKRAMHPAICFEGKDCIELPPRYDFGFGHTPVTGSDFASRNLHLTDEQEQLIKQLKDEAIVMLDNGVLTAQNAAILRGKLFQIAQGVVLLEDKTEHEVDCSPRTNDLMLALTTRRKKFIVFCSYKAVQRRVHRMLEAKGFNVGIVNGDTAKGKRRKIFDRYESDASFDGIVAHPETMAHGLNLTQGDLTYWWGPPQKPDHFDQGNHRQYRKGQDSAVNIWAAAAAPEEAAYFDTLLERGDLEKLTRSFFVPTK